MILTTVEGMRSRIWKTRRDRVNAGDRGPHSGYRSIGGEEQDLKDLKERGQIRKILQAEGQRGSQSAV